MNCRNCRGRRVGKKLAAYDPSDRRRPLSPLCHKSITRVFSGNRTKCQVSRNCNSLNGMNSENCKAVRNFKFNARIFVERLRAVPRQGEARDLAYPPRQAAETVPASSQSNCFAVNRLWNLEEV